MSPAVAELVEASKALSVEDRWTLFEALHDLVSEPFGDEELHIPPDLQAELERRWNDYRQRPETAVGWEEAKARLAALRDRP
jgi:putative addiction module component (TIGR02574 family)